MPDTISLADFFAAPLGGYILQWERQQYDRLVSDCFGYNAVQLGSIGVDFLKNNRIGFKIAADERLQPLTQLLSTDERTPLQMDFSEMPLDSECADLILLPHTLEMAADPHAVLRETQRVLIPGGRVIITGFNPASLWGIRVWFQKFGAKRFLPGRQFLSVSQVRDWLKLLSFHTDRGSFGRYGFTFSHAKCGDSWLERAGDRWWPQCGAIYLLSATKVVPGHKLVGRALNKKFFFLGTPSSQGANNRS